MAVQWPLLIFSVLLGVSSGILVFLGVGEIKGVFKKSRSVLAICALVLLVIGGCASAFHLDHIDRALYILGNPTSSFSRELFAVGFAAVMALVYAILSRKDYPKPTKVISILGMVAGLVLPLVAGTSFMMAARPAWDSFLMPLMYLGTGLGMGFAFGAAFVAGKGDGAETGFAAKLALVGVVVSAVVSLAYVAWIGMAPHPDPSRSVDLLFSGSLAMPFWLGVVVLGVVIPLVLAFVALRSAGKGGSVAVASVGADGTAAAPATAGLGVSAPLWMAFVCLLVGNVALRVIMYGVATSVEQLIYVF